MPLRIKARFRNSIARLSSSRFWYYLQQQFMPHGMWDYDEIGIHILIDGVINGEPRKLITHSAATASLVKRSERATRFCLARTILKPQLSREIPFAWKNGGYHGLPKHRRRRPAAGVG